MARRPRRRPHHARGGLAVTAPAGIRDAVRTRVHDHADALVALSHRIHAHPETAFEAACATGAGLALAPFADDLGLTVKVVGTPAEERGGGKALLLEAGVFDGVDAAMMVHPGPFETVRFRSFALGTLDAEYAGRSAHATLAPHEGRNAADAMTLAQVAIGLLRQQLPRDQHVHGVVTAAGETPNVIPARSAASYEIRAAEAGDLAGLRERVESCFRGAAVATGCELRLTRPEPDSGRGDLHRPGHPGRRRGRLVPACSH
ncbi:MAG: peptidase dimerization domain-containing protein [Nonomuraea sp.]|nr:peptidase dimerization domain-containing protein [Nonomuraea sp.]NUR89885.1 peptidase dimerization domain-containing protein [Nonomuraea sp.]